MRDRPKSRLLSGIRLYWILLSASMRAKMQYKFDFLASSIIQALMGMYDYLIVAVILWKFRTVQGWDIWEIGLLYAVSRVGWGIYRLIGEELDRFETYIVRGDFDSVLIRPWPSLFVLLSRNLDLTRLTWVIQGAAVGWISAAPLLKSGALTWAGVGHLVLASIWTACLYMAVGIATSSAAFKIVRIEELQVFTQNAPGTAVLYPLEIYPGWLRYLLLSVIPLGVGNYIPVRYVLGKGGTWFNLALPPVAAILSLYIAMLLWHAGEAKYHSTGS
ncbi:MAG: ABC-2 family transporter protein [Bacillota bacterium]